MHCSERGAHGVSQRPRPPPGGVQQAYSHLSQRRRADSAVVRGAEPEPRDQQQAGGQGGADGALQSDRWRDYQRERVVLHADAGVDLPEHQQPDERGDAREGRERGVRLGDVPLFVQCRLIINRGASRREGD